MDSPIKNFQKENDIMNTELSVLVYNNFMKTLTLVLFFEGLVLRGPKCYLSLSFKNKIEYISCRTYSTI